MKLKPTSKGKCYGSQSSYSMAKVHEPLTTSLSDYRPTEPRDHRHISSPQPLTHSVSECPGKHMKIPEYIYILVRSQRRCRSRRRRALHASLSLRFSTDSSSSSAPPKTIETHLYHLTQWNFELNSKTGNQSHPLVEERWSRSSPRSSDRARQFKLGNLCKDFSARPIIPFNGNRNVPTDDVFPQIGRFSHN